MCRKPRGRKAGSHRLEMASTSFKDDKGEEQTLTGLVVRHEILQNLINALHEHQGGVAHAAQAGDIAAAQALMNGAQNAAAMAGAIMHGVLLCSCCAGLICVGQAVSAAPASTQVVSIHTLCNIGCAAVSYHVVTELPAALGVE